MSKFNAGKASVLAFLATFFLLVTFGATPVKAYTFPSTNVLNKAKLVPGHVGQLVPYVDLVETGIGKVKLDFVGGFVGGAYFEYRIDGVILTSGDPQPVTGDFEYPGVWVIANTTVQRELSANEYVEVRLALGGERDWDFDWTRFEVEPAPAPAPTPETCIGDQHLDATGLKCVSFSQAGPPVRNDEGTSGQVLGASTTSTGQVLGASTLAGTGSFAENLYLAIMAVGGIITTLGVKNFKKAN